MRLISTGIILLLCCTVFFGCKSFGGDKTITLTAEPDYGAYVLSVSNDPGDSVLNSVIERTNITKQKTTAQFFSAFSQIIQKEQLTNNLAGLFVKRSDNTFYPGQSNSSVISSLNDKANTAIKHEVDILNGRIKKITKPAMVIFDSVQGRITVTFKGEEYAERIKAAIIATGDLEFYETYTNAEMFQFLQKVNDTLSVALSTRKQEQPEKSANNTADTGSLKEFINEKNKKRTEDSIAQLNRLFSVLLPNITQGNALSQGPIVGYVHIKDTVLLNKYLSSKAARYQLPADACFMYGLCPPVKIGNKEIPAELLSVYVIKQHSSKDGLNGDDVIGAKLGSDKMTPVF